MKKIVFFLICLTILFFGQNTNATKSLSIKSSSQLSDIPPLDELASDWLEVANLRNFHSVMNFSGGLLTTQNLTAFQRLSFPPYMQGEVNSRFKEGLNHEGELNDAKANWSGELMLNGNSVLAKETKWFPYEVQRKASVNGLQLLSSIRLPFEQAGVLMRLTIVNKTSKSAELNLSMHANARIRLYSDEHWQRWGNKRPNDAEFIAKRADSQKNIIIVDKLSQAVTAFSFVDKPDMVDVEGESGEISWNITLAPGKSKTIEYVIAIGKNENDVALTANRWSSKFDKEFDLAKMQWEQRWEASFIPGNKHFSGNFPTLKTTDAKIRRVYYLGALNPLLVCRTNLPLNPRCFVTVGPSWANTLTYFWDAEMWANTWAMLDPRSMRDQLIKWLNVDHHKCYAVDAMTGKGAGPWYASNDWAIFRCLEAYISVSGDRSFLNQKANSKTILQHLDDIATYFESRPLKNGSLIADYGGPDNLLECSPSYINGVPSLNAANVYMLRCAAKYQKETGNLDRAAELQAKAEKLLPEVMSLYKFGDGVWNARDKSGNEVPIRHCYDYITTGQALEPDLSPQIKSEMNNFVETELLTKTWMRAMSLKDPAASKSDRPDHGPMGSYDAWPPMTMDIMCRFGDFGKAADFLRATEAVSHLGPWSQSHEFIGADSRGFNPIVCTASRGGQDANEVCGTSFAEVIIRSFFGYRPDLSVDKPVLLSPEISRGFNGELKHVTWKGKLFTIVSDENGLHLIEESNN